MPITISSYTDADRRDLLLAWNTALPFDPVSLDLFEARVLLDDNFDPETLLIARSEGAFAGFIVGTYGRLNNLGDADPGNTRCWITALGVPAAQTLDSVGSTLLQALERRFHTLGKTECWISTYPPGYFSPGIDLRNYAPLLKFFNGKGYVQQKEALSMDAPIALFHYDDVLKSKEEKLKSEGIVIRQYRRDDLLKFLAFLEQTMPTDWIRVERRNLRKIAEGGFREQQITIVEHRNDIIGYCQYEGAHFGPFGVAERFQGRGIGTVLLAKTIDRMKTEGHHDAWVMWTDDIAAKVYGKFGFKETRRFAILRKPLTAAVG